jgi:SHAQKYF class myb-like DNA-binding protein
MFSILNDSFGLYHREAYVPSTNSFDTTIEIQDWVYLFFYYHRPLYHPSASANLLTHRIVCITTTNKFDYYAGILPRGSIIPHETLMNQANEQKGLLQPTNPVSHDTCNNNQHPFRSEREMIDGGTSSLIDTSPPAQQEARSTSIPSKINSKGIKRKAQKEQLTLTQPTDDMSSMDTTGAVGAEVATGRWTAQEHDAFIRGLALYGREWKRVAQIIPTRTSAQVRSHAQKYFHHFEVQQQRLQQQRISVIDTTQEQHRIHQTQTSHNTNSDVDSMSSMSLHGCIRNSALNFDSTFSRMSNSVREQVERIISNPSSVHNEVNLTLSQLRQRYQELQNRYIQLQVQQPSVSNSNNNSIRTEINPTENKNVYLPTRRPNLECMISSTSSNNKDNNTNNLDEQIVIEVLQGRLQHSSPNNTTTSAPTALYAPNNDAQQHSYLKSSINSYDYDGDAESDNDEMNT